MKTALTTPALIERMAFSSGREIEIHADTAFLTVGSTTWYAPLAVTA